MPYMLDTNICIYLMKRRPPAVLTRLAALRQGEAVMSVVTYAELRAGLELRVDTQAQNAQALARLVEFIPVLPFDDAAAAAYGRLRAAIRDRRRDAFDRLIAAHAVSLGLTLVTNNVADFADYPGLVLENWAEPA